MTLFISKLIRSLYYPKHFPNTCYYATKLPNSINNVCDCMDECKFKPRKIKCFNILLFYEIF